MGALPQAVELYGRVIPHPFVWIVKRFDDGRNGLGVVNGQAPQGADHGLANELVVVLLEHTSQCRNGLFCRCRADLGQGMRRKLLVASLVWVREERDEGRHRLCGRRPDAGKRGCRPETNARVPMRDRCYEVRHPTSIFPSGASERKSRLMAYGLIRMVQVRQKFSYLHSNLLLDVQLSGAPEQGRSLTRASSAAAKTTDG